MNAVETIEIAVVGAHLSGMPLNYQLTELGATLAVSPMTTPRYRLYALPFGVPPKPGLKRVITGGVSIAVELWSMPIHAVGAFLLQVESPLAIGSLELNSGQWVRGFVCEPWGLEDAEDVSSYGGWRAYMTSRSDTQGG